MRRKMHRILNKAVGLNWERRCDSRQALGTRNRQVASRTNLEAKGELAVWLTLTTDTHTADTQVVIAVAVRACRRRK